MLTRLELFPERGKRYYHVSRWLRHVFLFCVYLEMKAAKFSVHYSVERQTLLLYKFPM